MSIWGRLPPASRSISAALGSLLIVDLVPGSLYELIDILALFVLLASAAGTTSGEVMLGPVGGLGVAYSVTSTAGGFRFIMALRISANSLGVFGTFSIFGVALAFALESRAIAKSWSRAYPG